MVRVAQFKFSYSLYNLLIRKYEEAMEAVTGTQARELKCYSALQVGRTYLDFLLSKGEFQKAARLCVNILGLYLNFFTWLTNVTKHVSHQVKKSRCGKRKFSSLLACTNYELLLPTYLEVNVA